MKTKYRIYFLMSLVILYLTSCMKIHKIEGNHHVETDTRQVKEFTAIENNGDIDVIVTFDSTNSIRVEAERNLLPYIETYISGKTLIIEKRRHFIIRNHEPIKVYVNAYYVDDITINGSGNVDATGMDAKVFTTDIKGSGDLYLNVQADDLHVKINGSGSAEIHGKSSDFDVQISGSGNVDAYSLDVKNTYIKINGSGNTQTSTSDLLDVTINGSGNVYYKGNPRLSTQINGSGKIINNN